MANMHIDHLITEKKLEEITKALISYHWSSHHAGTDIRKTDHRSIASRSTDFKLTDLKKAMN